MKHTTGLVIGKFLPPHKGHQYLFNFAQQYCEHLIIVVDSIEGQQIDPEVRRDWIAKTMPQATVIALKDFMPQDPSETPQFWPIWKNTLLQCVGGKPDVLIAAMDYGWELSKQLDCQFIPCDIARESIPICATEIRDNPMLHWKYIMDSAKPYFMKKVCLIGPESAGKTTCAIKLSQYYDTVFVPEYAKSVIEQQQGQFYYENVEQVALAQTRSEKALEHMVNRFMVCDSDIITTTVWSDFLFGKHPAILDTIAENQTYDLTLLFKPDVKWKKDIHRDAKHSDILIRDDFFHKMEQKLILLNRNYRVIEGSYEDRYNQAINCINDNIIQPNKTKSALKI